LKILSAILLIFALGLPAWARLSPLASAPDWGELDPFQESLTRADFQTLLDRVYAPNGAWRDVIVVEDGGARILRGSGETPYFLKFAGSREEARRPPVYWKRRSELPPAPAGKPLSGLRIAIDPGHIGGEWAKIEERWFRVGDSKPVTEGDMTLHVAKLLVPRLKALGADVTLTRSKPSPVTSARPGGLRKAAVASLRQKEEAVTAPSVTKESERLFYRTSEIRRRAQLVNSSIRPDLVLCLHFNAEDWGNERQPRLVDANHLHFLITGAWSAEELTYEDQRFEMLVKLLNRSFSEELPVTNTLAGEMARATRLPPYTYEGGSVVRVGDNPYVWGRNLLANRLFTCPVVYVEPYVMNSRSAHARIQAGDYDGLRNFGGTPRKSIYKEYADAVAAGLAQYYSSR